MNSLMEMMLINCHQIGHREMPMQMFSSNKNHAHSDFLDRMKKLSSF